MSIEDDFEPAHAERGPSGWKRWSTCTAAIEFCKGYPDNESVAARWGSTNHLLSELCLKTGEDPEDHLGRIVRFWKNGDSKGLDWREEIDVMMERSSEGTLIEPYADVVIDEEQVKCARTYVTYVHDVMKGLPPDAVLMIEQRVRIEHITGERNAKGTSDVIIIVPSQRLVIVIDLKGGMIRVESSYAERVVELQDLFGNTEPRYRQRPNMQLGMYAHGAIFENELFCEHPFEHIELHICQPRVNNFSQFRITRAELEAEVQLLRDAIAKPPVFAPSDEACMFCRGKDFCKARNGYVSERLLEGFDAVTDEPILKPVSSMPLGQWYEFLPMAKRFLRDVEERCFVELRHGRPLPGGKLEYKLVAGDAGDRKWSDTRGAEVLLKEGAPFAKLYTEPKLLSPTQIEEQTKRKRNPDGGKMLAPIIPAEVWEKAKTFINRAPASAPKIVPVTDLRPRLDSATDGFEEQPESDDSIF